MTTATTVRIVVRCVNPYCRWFGKPLGEFEVSRETISITDTRMCLKCKQTNRQTLRIG